ncbi:hypothetical protein MHYP_G00122430 [Metynnis hypsauchen]
MERSGILAAQPVPTLALGVPQANIQGSMLEFRLCSSEGVAAWMNRLPANGCSNEATVADRLHEQLHEDTLVDADVAIDSMMWQNGGMCGLDHWNFIMHPDDAALTCDPYGNFVRQWCPELKALPDDYP